mgnify:FL=1
MKRPLHLLLAGAVLATVAVAAPTRTDKTRPNLPYNPARYDHEGRVRSFTTKKERDANPPFFVERPIVFRVSKVAEGGIGRVETRERLLVLFAEIARTHSYDVATNQAVAKAKNEGKEGGPRVLDQEAFLDAIKAGQTFTVTLVEKRRCPACQGEGVLRPRIEHGENRDLPRKDWKKCPWSDGEPDADFAVTYEVKW